MLFCAGSFIVGDFGFRSHWQSSSLVEKVLEVWPGFGANGDLYFGGFGVDDDDDDDDDVDDGDDGTAVFTMGPQWIREPTHSFCGAEMDSTVGGPPNDLFAGGHQDAVPEVASASFGASFLCTRFANADLLLVVLSHVPFCSLTCLLTVLKISQFDW